MGSFHDKGFIDSVLLFSFHELACTFLGSLDVRRWECDIFVVEEIVTVILLEGGLFYDRNASSKCYCRNTTNRQVWARERAVDIVLY